MAETAFTALTRVQKQVNDTGEPRMPQPIDAIFPATPRQGM